MYANPDPETAVRCSCCNEPAEGLRQCDRCKKSACQECLSGGICIRCAVVTPATNRQTLRDLERKGLVKMLDLKAFEEAEEEGFGPERPEDREAEKNDRKTDEYFDEIAMERGRV